MKNITLDMIQEAIKQIKPLPVIIASPRTMEAVAEVLKDDVSLLNLVEVNPHVPDNHFYIVDRSVLPYARPRF